MYNAMSMRAAMLQIPAELLEIRKMKIHLGVQLQIAIVSKTLPK
jgi:hypothetical protein